jgi:hypothetical protein
VFTRALKQCFVDKAFAIIDGHSDFHHGRESPQFLFQRLTPFAVPREAASTDLA